MSASYQQVLLLMWMCLVVPGAISFAPAVMTHSRIARLAIHVGVIAFGLLGFLWTPAGPWRRSFLLVSVLALVQYWAIVALEGAFERRYGRPPNAMFLVSRLNIRWEDRVVMLAYWALAIGAIVVLIAASPPIL